MNFFTVTMTYKTRVPYAMEDFIDCIRKAGVKTIVDIRRDHAALQFSDNTWSSKNLHTILPEAGFNYMVEGFLFPPYRLLHMLRHGMPIACPDDGQRMKNDIYTGSKVCTSLSKCLRAGHPHRRMNDFEFLTHYAQFLKRNGAVQYAERLLFEFPDCAFMTRGYDYDRDIRGRLAELLFEYGGHKVKHLQPKMKTEVDYRVWHAKAPTLQRYKPSR